MLIQALVLLRSYLQHPCQVSPHPHSPRLVISPGSVTSRLGWQCHTLPLTPPPSSLLRSPTCCCINSHSHPRSVSPVHSLRYFGARTMPGPRACQDPVHARAPQVCFWLSGTGVQGIGFVPQLSLPLPFQAIQLSHAQDGMREL